MTNDRFDVIVVGAGLGGLTAAGYLAKAGQRVLVLEHYAVPGGYAHEFKRGGYRFEVSLHALDGAGPGGWAYPVLADLGVLDSVRFHRLDPFYTARFPEHEITAHADPLAYEAELTRHFPHESQGIRRLIDAMIQVFYEVRRFMADGELGQRPPVEQMPAVCPNMLAAMDQSWQQFMSRHISDPRLQTVFNALWGYYGLPPSRLNAATFILVWVSYHLFGAYYPEGGSMAMSRALEETIQDHGGQVRYRQTVNRIEVQDGRAVAVETDKGLRVQCDAVISNASAPDTLLTCVGRDELPDGYVRKINRSKPSLSNLVVYLGLQRDLLVEGWPHHELFVYKQYDIEASYEAAMAGRFDEADIAITHYNRVDPRCAPQGGSVVSIFSLAPWDYADQWGTGGDLTNYRKNARYLDLKQEAGEKLLSRFEHLLPGAGEAIEFCEVATPLTNKRYSRNPHGAIYGSEQTVANMYMGRLATATPIPNLFLAGAWVNSGGGQSVAMLSGRDAARMAQACLAGTKGTCLMAPDIPESEDRDAQEMAGQISTGTGKAPAITLTAVGSGRDLVLTDMGTAAVLIFHTQKTAAARQAVNQAVRQRYPLAALVVVASVVDLHGVPRLFRKIAHSAMQKSYQQAAAELPQGLPASRYVVILPDWDGALTQAFGLGDMNKTAGVAVLDHSGKTVGVYQGNDPAAATLAMLAEAGV